MINAQALLSSSLAPNTKKTYVAAINMFGDFCKTHQISPVIPATITTLVLFMSHLSLQRLSPSTVTTYVSAISFYHKVNNFPDPTGNFIIMKLKEGIRRSSKRQNDPRLPITIDVLRQICQALQYVCSSDFEVIMFKAAFTLAFCAFLRVSEFTVPSKSAMLDASRTLLWQDVILIDEKECHIVLKVTKANQSGNKVVMQLQASSSDLCPVSALRHYIKQCPSKLSGPFFVHFDQSPLTRFQFSQVLRKAICFSGIPNGNQYKSHSFRIGASSQAFVNKLTEEEIKNMGRWSQKADTHRRYIRIPTQKLLSL